MKVRAGMKAQTGESQGKYEPSQTHRTRGKPRFKLGSKVYGYSVTWEDCKKMKHLGAISKKTSCFQLAYLFRK